MIEISDKLKKWIRTIPQEILWELHDITQDYEYELNDDGTINWRRIDEFTQEISYACREHNNPDMDIQKGLVFNIELQKWFIELRKWFIDLDTLKKELKSNES